MEPVILTEGMEAPDFTLMGSDHQQHSLQECHAEGKGRSNERYSAVRAACGK